MGLLGIVQNDIKRVVAYSTLSQLGYMTVALGASAYSVAIFHLMTHAFFKALLFLGAGSVIIAHAPRAGHAQAWAACASTCRSPGSTALIGSLALVGTPFFSGFYSKDAIILAAEHAAHAGQPVPAIAYWAVLAGVFVTAFYSFRMSVPRLPRQGARSGDHATRMHHGDHELHEASHERRSPRSMAAIRTSRPRS